MFDELLKHYVSGAVFILHVLTVIRSLYAYLYLILENLC